MEEHYCQTYALTSLSMDELQELITSITEGLSGKFGSIETPWGYVDVNRNDEADESSAAMPDGFLSYPYFLDIGGPPGTSEKQFKNEVIKITEALWSQGIVTVSACDFEDELPHKGRYDKAPTYRPENDLR